LVAEIVAVAPALPPDKENAGVVSLVRLSVFDVPESEVARRSGALAGADGTVVSTTRLIAGLAAEELPAASVTLDVTLHVPSLSIGRSHD
jgi:hypothetical protein